jgi:hypothetical protein
MSSRACGFCRTVGHRIDNCFHPDGLNLVIDAEFKSRIALQYVDTNASLDMFSLLQEWFVDKSVAELKFLICSKGYVPRGNKTRLVALNISIYYFNQNVEITRHIDRQIFVCVKRYYTNIADGMLFTVALEQYNLDIDNLNNRTNKKLIILNGLESKEIECPICLETEKSIAKTNCGHIFCRACITRHTKNIASNACPCCRTVVSEITVN